MKTVKIIAGIFLAFALLWLAGIWFCDSPFILIPHPELNSMGYPEGSRMLWRSEGNGESRFGVWGVPAISDIHKHPEPKIILWGDSYVQASQVDDDKKMAQQVTRLLTEKGRMNLLAVGAGVAGQSVADYLLKIPVYEKQMPPVAAHVVVIGQIEDLFSDNPSARFSRLVSKPDLHIVSAGLRCPSHLKYLVYQWGIRLKANGVLSVARTRSDGIRLRFSMGPVIKKNDKAEQTAASATDMGKWFRFYAAEFRRATDKPLILVYLPTVPRLDGNGWSFVDENEETSVQMERLFTANGWVVINMGDRFVREFQSTGRLPRGFSNSQPGTGHLNETGHRLVAETLAEHLSANGTGALAPTPDTRPSTLGNR